MIVYKDKVALSMLADNPKRLVVLKDGTMNFHDFMKKYKHIFQNEAILQQIIEFTKAIIRRRRTYDKENEKEIISILKPCSDHWYTMRKYLKLGYAFCSKHHLKWFISLCFGFQTPSQLLEINLIKNGQWILDVNNENDKKLYVYDHPKFGVTPEFIITVGKFLGLNWFSSYRPLISCGSHTLSSFLADYESFFEFSCCICFTLWTTG